MMFFSVFGLQITDVEIVFTIGQNGKLQWRNIEGWPVATN